MKLAELAEKVTIPGFLNISTNLSVLCFPRLFSKDVEDETSNPTTYNHEGMSARKIILRPPPSSYP